VRLVHRIDAAGAVHTRTVPVRTVEPELEVA
jgi:hypothetical protein